MYLPGGYEGDQEEEDNSNLGVEEAGNQCPVDAHDDAALKLFLITNEETQVLSLMSVSGLGMTSSVSL